MVITQRVHRFEQKGNITKRLPANKINNLKNLLRRFKRIPVENLMSVYYLIYNQMLDPEEDFGSEHGFIGCEDNFLKEGIVIDWTGKMPIMHLENRDKSRLLSLTGLTITRNKLELVNGSNLNNSDSKSDIFDIIINDKLWFGRYKQLLEESSLSYLTIDQTPLEMARIRDDTRVANFSRVMHKILSSYDNGIELTSLPSQLIDKTLFNVSTIAEITSDYPEIFLKIRRMAPEGNIASFQDILFDGHTKTYSDIDGFLNNLTTNPAKIAYRSIMTGMYQRTLILIKISGSSGFPIHVWSESMRKSFPGLNKKEESILNLDALEFFYKLEYYKLLRIVSGKNGKNDLRAFLPSTELNFNQIYEQICTCLESNTKRLKYTINNNILI